MRSSPSWFSAMVNVRHWVARHTNVVLITWFVAVAAVLGGFVVKPLFDRYVAHLIDQRQLIEQTIRHQRLHQRQLALSQAIEAIDAASHPLDLMALVKHLSDIGEVLDVQVTSDQWVVNVAMSDQSDVGAIYDLLSRISGLAVDTLTLQTMDGEQQLRLLLEPSDAVWLHTVDRPLPELAWDDRLGELSTCPTLRLRAQLGEQFQVVMNDSDRLSIATGDWLNADWRFLGYRDQQFILKNGLGRTCVKPSS